MNSTTRLTLEKHLGTKLHSLRSVTGGDINQAYQAQTDDGRTLFIKTNPTMPSLFFETEAQGLKWLSVAQGLRVPSVVGQSSEGEPAFLILEWLDSGRASTGFAETLGHGLALLHLNHPSQFGLDHDNYIGTLPQSNAAHPSWSEFYREQRLRPQFQLAIHSHQLSVQCIQALEITLERLESILAPEELPSRLHGDLWIGNVHTDTHGAPVLIDPAVYGGHREMDIAMMKLFGGFEEDTFAAYHAAYPLESGWEDRIELHQLYPLLVHVNLFGGHYAQSVERIAKRYR